MKLFPGAALAGIVFTAGALILPVCYGQEQQQQQPPQVVEEHPKDMRRITFGLTGRYIITGTLEGKGSTKTVDNPSSTIDYNGSATPKKYDFGPVLEFRLNRHFSVVAEGNYHPVSYKLVTTTTYNAPIPRGVLLSTVSETTKARVFDIPVLLKFRNFSSSGPLSHAFIAGGGAVRLLSNISSTTTLTYSDSTTSTSNAPVAPQKRTVSGLVAGAGLRFTDELGIHVTPEARYTHWFGSNFDVTGITFPKSQLEIGVSFSF